MAISPVNPPTFENVLAFRLCAASRNLHSLGLVCQRAWGAKEGSPHKGHRRNKEARHTCCSLRIENENAGTEGFVTLLMSETDKRTKTWIESEGCRINNVMNILRENSRAHTSLPATAVNTCFPQVSLQQLHVASLEGLLPKISCQRHSCMIRQWEENEKYKAFLFQLHPFARLGFHTTRQSPIGTQIWGERPWRNLESSQIYCLLCLISTSNFFFSVRVESRKLDWLQKVIRSFAQTSLHRRNRQWERKKLRATRHFILESMWSKGKVVIQLQELTKYCCIASRSLTDWYLMSTMYSDSREHE